MAGSFYEQVDPRRKQERKDARMISEDHNAIGNLSETPIYREFNQDRFVEHLKMYDQDDR